MRDTPTAPLFPVANTWHERFGFFKNWIYDKDGCRSLVFLWLFFWSGALTQSVGDSRLHAVGENMGDAVLVLRLGQDDDPDVPQSVDGHLDARRLYESPPFSPPTPTPPNHVPGPHLFEADVCDVPQDPFDGFGQLPLAQGVLLGPDDVNVVRDMIGGVVPRLPLTFALKPRADVVRGAGVSCGGARGVISHVLRRVVKHA